MSPLTLAMKRDPAPFSSLPEKQNENKAQRKPTEKTKETEASFQRQNKKHQAHAQYTKKGTSGDAIEDHASGSTGDGVETEAVGFRGAILELEALKKRKKRSRNRKNHK